MFDAARYAIGPWPAAANAKCVQGWQSKSWTASVQPILAVAETVPQTVHGLETARAHRSKNRQDRPFAMSAPPSTCAMRLGWSDAERESEEEAELDVTSLWGIEDDGLAGGLWGDAFDPVSALLDEGWRRLGLGNDDEEVEEGHEKDGGVVGDGSKIDDGMLSGNGLHKMEMSMAERTVAWQSEFVEIERQLREAIRDADALEGVVARAEEERCYVIGMQGANGGDFDGMFCENSACARDVAVLQEGMLTLSAAHEVDARMNALLIGDQADEIRELRDKLEICESERRLLAERVNAGLGRELVEVLRDSNGRHSASPSTGGTSSILSDAMDAKGIAEEEGADAVDKCGSIEGRKDDAYEGENMQNQSPARKLRIAARRVSSRSPRHNDQLEKLQRRKDRLFKDYERKHSTTIEHIVQRTSSRLSVDFARTRASEPAKTDN